MEKIKRKTITFSRDFLAPLRRLNKNDQAEILNALLDHFLDGKTIEYPDYSETVQAVLACLTIEMRKLESKYTNGKSAKVDTSLFNCREKTSEMKRNEANLSESHIKNIPYNKYNTENIYNHLYKQTTVHAHAHMCESQKNNNYDLEQELERIAKLDPAVAQRTKVLIMQLQSEEGDVLISGRPKARAEILQAYSELLHRDSALEVLQYAYKEVDTTPGIRNPYKYTVSMLYNIATNNQKQKNDDQANEMIHHKYTKEQLNDLFDTI